MRDLTHVVHHTVVNQEGFLSLAVPLHRASTIVFDTAQDYADRKRRGPDGYSYGLQGTPTTKTLEAKLSILEQAARTIILPSGQSAIASLFLAILRPGDTVLIPDCVYPQVRALCEGPLSALGIRHRIYPPMVGAGIADYFDDTVRLLWTEAPGSTTMEVGDLPAMVAAARAAGILTGCDNTWATPLLFKPLAIGMDFSVSALTKYIAGHSDVLLGSISMRAQHWHAPIAEHVRMLGIGVSPDDCALALRGFETLGVRLGHIAGVALDFAQRLAAHPAVERVLHPALPGSPGHEHWARDFHGSTGVFSVVLRPDVDARLDGALALLRVFVIGASWGGTRSLVAPMTVVRDFDDQGLRDVRFLRISIGLEDSGDLWADLSRVLDFLEGKDGDG